MKPNTVSTWKSIGSLAVDLAQRLAPKPEQGGEK